MVVFCTDSGIADFAGAVGPGLGVVLASYAGCDKFLVTVLFTIGMGLMGFCYASLRVNSLDLSPNYAGSIMALVNGLSSVSGMATPYLIGVLTPNVRTKFVILVRDFLFLVNLTLLMEHSCM